MGQLLFILLSVIVFYFAYKQYRQVYLNIRLGKDMHITGDSVQRWKRVFLIAFGQKKMFKLGIPAILHLFIYIAFLFTQVELIEIIIDGITGSHRIFAPFLGRFYGLIITFIEILSLLALVATLIFLWRRNMLRLPRFTKTELLGWPQKDANIILIAEIILVVGIFTMNGADFILQQRLPDIYPAVSFMPISGVTGPLFFDNIGTPELQLLERLGWWLHLMVVYGFILYLPYSKHLHIFLAFPNVYFSKLTPRGEMENMPEIMTEVKSMLGIASENSVEQQTGELPDFGAKDIFDLSWKNILDAYACTECGRCTDVCPANLTGKKLSPRKIMMDIRDRASEVGQNIAQGKYGVDADQHKTYEDGKSLFDYITAEEIRACTTCNACVEACPILINPLEPILQMRRYEILTASSGPADWTPMFTSLENSGAVWQMPNSRTDWINE